MATQVSYPGVYIEEFAPAAPIQGVGTSTAAFLGINAKAPPNQPQLITSWDAFIANFTDGGTPADDDHLWYAVRGFFANGGKVCFVTAISNASHAEATLTDETNPNAEKSINLRARKRGVRSPAIQATAESAHRVPVDTTKPAALYRPTGAVKSTSTDRRTVTVTDAAEAAQFRAGDRLRLGTGSAAVEALVARVTDKVISLTEALDAVPGANASLRLADLPDGTTTFRVENALELVAGSIITLSQTGATSFTTSVRSVTPERISATLTTYRVTVEDGIRGFDLYKVGARILLQSQEFKLTLNDGTPPYLWLSMNPRHPRYFRKVINEDPAGSVLAEPVDPPSTTAPPANRPKGTVTLTGGADHQAAAIRLAPLPFYEAALKALEGIADVSLVAVPDTTEISVQQAVRDHCTRQGDRFAILDAAKGTELANIEIQRNALESPKGFAALYYPWIEVTSLDTGKRLLVPPSGHVAGIYTRTDNTRGVHKAPAGNEATLAGVLGVERSLSDADQGFINLKGINVIRVFRHGGVPVVWGARTTAADTNWQYVNIRRLFLFLEESIQQGIRGSVFEPNNTSLWKKLKRTIGAFLTQQWRDGALFGNTPEEAFYVRIDEVLNPDSERALGRLTLEIGIRPSYPAEFIVVRIGIWQGGSTVSEE